MYPMYELTKPSQKVDFFDADAVTSVVYGGEGREVFEEVNGTCTAAKSPRAPMTSVRLSIPGRTLMIRFRALRVMEVSFPFVPYIVTLHTAVESHTSVP